MSAEKPFSNACCCTFIWRNSPIRGGGGSCGGFCQFKCPFLGLICVQVSQPTKKRRLDGRIDRQLGGHFWGYLFVYLIICILYIGRGFKKLRFDFCLEAPPSLFFVLFFVSVLKLCAKVVVATKITAFQLCFIFIIVLHHLSPLRILSPARHHSFIIVTQHQKISVSSQTHIAHTHRLQSVCCIG